MTRLPPGAPSDGQHAETALPSALDLAWVRNANRRWIVHHNLDARSEAYLQHLDKTDPRRLLQSCSNARRMVRERPANDDPKPWFYSGLFSLAG